MNALAVRLHPHWRKQIGWTLLALGLAVYFFVPVTAVLDTSLDASNYASYTRFAAQHRQFGTEVVPMAGPYGFVVYGWVYNGDLYALRLVLEFITKLVFSLLVFGVFPLTKKTGRAAASGWSVFGWATPRGAPRLGGDASPYPPSAQSNGRAPVTSWIWLLANLLVLPTTGELTYDLPVLYAALFLLFERPRWWLSALTVSFLAFLALCKGTQLIFTLAVLAVVCGEAAWRRAWRDLSVMIVGFFLALIILWCAAGQSLSNLPSYIRNIQELSAGYVSGMALQESSRTFAVGIASVCVTLLSLVLLFLPHRRQPAIIAGVLLLAGFAFLQWKHGFVRADGHVFLFFHYCILGGLTALVLDSLGGRETSAFGLRSTLCATGVVLALYGNGEHVGIRFREYGNALARNVPTSLRQILRPGADRKRFEATLADNRVRFALPEVAERVGHSSIGFFGYQSGYLTLNGLNERPSPVAGGGPFSVFTPHLQHLNEQHLLSPVTRPDFHLLKLQTIDDHFVPQDDAPSLNALLQLYRPIMAERGMLLLQTHRDTPSPPLLRQLKQLEFQPGDELTVPTAGADEMVLAAIDLPSSFTGRIRSALYKSAIVNLHVTIDGLPTPSTRRIIPSMAATPFIVSPMLETTEDLLALYSSAGGRAVRTLQVTLDPASGLASKGGTITFFAQRRPAALEADSKRELAEQFSYLFANRAPTLVKSSNARAKEVDGRMVQLLEPPGRIVFTLGGDERELLFDYGFDPEAYTRGTTDGADFIVELVSPGGQPEQIYLSRREPRTIERDRGRQHAHLWLPVFEAGTQLQLRTGGGVRDAADWDWTYYDNIRLHSGPLRPEQFPGFSVAPISVEGTAPRMIKHENRDVLLLNAPGKLIFQLTGSERAVRFSGGLIPGSYIEGNTDGVEFIVEVQRPDGAIDGIFRRWLRPKTITTDRGAQSFEVPLPPQPAGARLVVRTAPGPHGDASWDWSYLADFRLENLP